MKKQMLKDLHQSLLTGRELSLMKDKLANKLHLFTTDMINTTKLQVVTINKKERTKRVQT